MKSLLTFLMMIAALQVNAADLEDLGTIDLNLDSKSAPTEVIQYPGYRLGGGRPAPVKIDCLVLDIQDSDHVITAAVKMKLAQRLVVEDGFNFGNNGVPTLKPELKGTNVVFPLVSGGGYLTHITVSSKNGKSLKSNINAAIPRSEDENNAIPVGLVYVRACRF